MRLTYFDLVEHLITASFGGPQDAEQRDIRTAVLRSYDEVTQIRDWSWYSRHARIITQVPFSTGTVTTAGSTVTLAGGIWPNWAAGAHLKVGNEIVRVRVRTSATQLTVDLGFKANITAATPYVLYRTEYPLPSDFRNLDEPSDEYNWWAGLYITPDEAMKLERVSNSTGEPYHWTVVPYPATGLAGPQWALKLIGYPTKAETIDFTYRRSPRPLRLSGHEARARAGTIEANQTIIAGSGTQFSASMVGSLLRSGTASERPGVDTSLTPYVGEDEILSVQSATGLTLRGGISPEPQLGTFYLITDPLDVAPHMRNVMYSAAEYWLARIRGKGADDAYGMYQRDLRLAFEMEQLAPYSGRSSEVMNYGGWRSPILPDVG